MKQHLVSAQYECPLERKMEMGACPVAKYCLENRLWYREARTPKADTIYYVVQVNQITPRQKEKLTKICSQCPLMSQRYKMREQEKQRTK